MPEIFMRFPQGKQKAFTLSFDDGVYQDVRLCNMMNKAGVKGTLNLSAGRFSETAGGLRMTQKEALNFYKGCGQEIAAHCFEHAALTHLPVGSAAYQIVHDRELLEEMFETIIRGFAYPYGYYNDEICSVLANCGILYGRTVLSTHGFDMPENLLKWHPTCKWDDSAIPSLMENFMASTAVHRPILFYVWGHSFEFDRNDGDGWQKMQNLLEQVGGRNDIWYATNGEIAEYTACYRSLISSVNGNRIYNPTVTEVWFYDKYRQKTCSVKPGETLILK